MAARPRLLVTGFGAFPGAPRNPTQALVEQTRMGKVARLKGVDLVAQVLPVEYALLDTWPGVLDAARPDAVVHFGLAAGARTIRVETRALNNAAPYRRDAAGRLPPRRPDPAGPAILRASLPVDVVMDAIAATGAFVRRSHDAGDYLCNAILYSSLRWCARNRGGANARRAMAGFIHVPRRPAQELEAAFEAALAAIITRLGRTAASRG